MFCAKRPKYTLTVDERGLFSLSTPDAGVLIDRGGLNEWIDLSGGAVADQAHRDRVHWLQVGKSVVHGKDHFVVSRGLLSCSGKFGGMSYRNEIHCEPDYLYIDVWRRYITDCTTVGDDSICFLAPGGLYWSYHAGGGTGYETRDDGGAWTKVNVAPERMSTVIPQRLICKITHSGWAAMMGGRGGVGIVVESYSPDREGLLRCTRPTLDAHIKFDEIELQFRPFGSRKDGDTEEARIYVVPAPDAMTVELLWRERCLRK
jgi:hypothetical protein